MKNMIDWCPRKVFTVYELPATNANIRMLRGLALESLWEVTQESRVMMKPLLRKTGYLFGVKTPLPPYEYMDMVTTSCFP